MARPLPLTGPGPDQVDVDIVRELLDLMEKFRSNDQRARYLLSSNWMRDRGAAAANRLTAPPKSAPEATQRPATPEDPPCSCGRPGAIVYLTDKFGAVSSCR